MDLGTPLWGVQLIRAFQEALRRRRSAGGTPQELMPNALIVDLLEGQRSFRLNQRLLNEVIRWYPKGPFSGVETSIEN